MASADEQYYKWAEERNPSAYKDGATKWSEPFHLTGLQAWKVTEVSVEEWKFSGKFFSEEVYIVLNCTKSPTAMNYDIHCWVGKSASNKLYARGLYYAIALDNAMEGRDDVDYYRVLVHREVQDYESKRFMNYFEDFTVLKGTSEGCDNLNLHSVYKKRLLRITGPTGTGRNICVRETSLKRGALLESNDVFIVDTGTKIYLWIGSGLSRNEKKVIRAKEYAKKLKDERGSSGILVVTVDENEATKNHALYEVFPYQAKKSKSVKRGEFATVFGQKKKTMYIYPPRPSTQAGRGGEPFEEVNVDLCSRWMTSEHVTIVDVRFGRKDGEDHLFLRIGNDWQGDRKSGLIIGHYYLRWLKERMSLPSEYKHPEIAITVVQEGHFSHQLSAYINS